MSTQILSEKNAVALEKERICCWGMIRSNMEELFRDYPQLVSRIEVIVDDNVKKQGTAVLQGKEFPVISSEAFSELPTGEFFVLITADYHEEVLKKS